MVWIDSIVDNSMAKCHTIQNAYDKLNGDNLAILNK